MQQWGLGASDPSIGDGGGVDVTFRNSGIVVAGDALYAVNGVHPIGGSLTRSYPKSVVRLAMSSGTSVASAKWCTPSVHRLCFRPYKVIVPSHKGIGPSCTDIILLILRELRFEEGRFYVMRT